MAVRDEIPNLPAAGIIAGVPFAEPELARRNLARIGEALPPEVVSTLLVCLAESADPDQALNFFERLVTSSGQELSGLLASKPQLVHYSVLVFGASKWLGETLIQNLDLLPGFAQELVLGRLHSCDDYRENFARFRLRAQPADITLLLAQFKRREYVRIMLRDVLNIATLAETTTEISALSDVLIDEALQACAAEMRERYGWPEHHDAAGRLVPTPFSVIALGKLGGNELNYSSDVDLLYLYGEGEDAGRSSISAREFYIRLAQELTATLGRLTPAGAVFRTDLRLRPYGNEGEPAVRLGYALDYYANIAQDWELQALIKARRIAGDAGICRTFISAVEPQIYRRELNFAAVKTALVSLEKIQRHQRLLTTPARSSLDVKLGRGGIRDIEFLAQCLQRLHGGHETWLRSGGTLFSLQKLHDKAHISIHDFQHLTSAYTLLRRVEHLLQLAFGCQTHRLPVSRAEMTILQRALAGGRVPAEENLEETLREHMRAANEIYSRIVLLEHGAAQVAESGAATQTAGEVSLHQLSSRLAADSPALHELLVGAELGSPMRKNLLRFLGAASTSAERYQAVLTHAEVLRGAADIFAHSDYLTDLLTRTPEEVELLEDLTPASAGEGASAQSDVLAGRVRHAGDEAEVMTALRAHYRRASFLVGARDVLRPGSVWDSLAGLTAAADAVVGAALAACGPPPGLAVFALGRLGAREFDLLSDADLIFLRSEELDAQKAQRAAVEMVQLVSAYTREGPAFSVDTRLRPFGSQGELVITPARLESYLLADAQPWEALSYQKLRFLAGERALANAALVCVAAMITRFRCHGSLRSDLLAMRARLERSAGRDLNFKLSAGGVYDLDFIAGSCAIRQGALQPPANLVDRLQGLREAGALGEKELAALVPAAEFLRSLEHAVRLVEDRNRKSLPQAEATLNSVRWLLPGLLGRPLEGSLEGELHSRMQAVRREFNSAMKD